MPRPSRLSDTDLELTVRMYYNNLNLWITSDLCGVGYGTLWRFFDHHKVPRGPAHWRTKEQIYNIRVKIWRYMIKKGW